MKTKIFIVMAIFIFMSCAAVPTTPKDPVCMDYIATNVPAEECFDALSVLARQRLIDLIAYKFVDEPGQLYINLAQELWREKDARRIIGLVLVALKTFPETEEVMVYYSGVLAHYFTVREGRFCHSDGSLWQDKKPWPDTDELKEDQREQNSIKAGL